MTIIDTKTIVRDVFFFFPLKWKSFFRILEIFLKLSFSFPAIIITLILFKK